MFSHWIRVSFSFYLIFKKKKSNTMHCTVSKTAFSLFFKDYNNIGKFLNRILGMEVQQQNALFQYFSDTLNAVVQNAKKNGRYDMGILGKRKRVPKVWGFLPLLLLMF